jgi:N-acetylglucosaminyldiphosphoundecaprenol N-acetyl-beta-D-mannosaminyltransferase
MRSNICGVEIDQYSFDEVTEQIVNHILTSGSPEYVVTPNAHHVVTLQSDERFRQIYREAFLVVPDGVSLLWAAKFLNAPLQDRVNGTDLFEKLCAIAAEKHLKIFLLGGRPGAAEGAAQVLKKRHPDLNIVGTYCPPYGFEKNPTELDRINTAIQTGAPHILFVGLGAPKQEYWIFDNYKALDVPISVGIGVSFEFVAGVVERAPKLMQSLGLEWLFRLLVEPRRLWQRYIVGNTVFVSLIIRQRLRLL